MQERIEVTTDVLVVGGGLGGCHAALRAAELGASVTLVEKAVVSRAGPMTYVHSQFAPNRQLENDPELPAWMDEFVVGSNYLADQDWVKQYIVEAYDRIEEQIDWGVPYTRNADGSLKYVTVRGHKIGTTLGVDGRVCMEIMRRKLKQKRVNLIEKVAVIDLLTSDGERPTKGAITGAVGVHVRTGQPYVFNAKNVILNVGPWYPKIHYAFADHCTGEGHGAAWRAGAEFAGMEFAQFAAWSYFNKQFFTPGQAKIQGIGAHFINAAGERFMERYDPVWGEQTGLFQMARAILTEQVEGRGPCYVDFRHVDPADMAVLYEVSPTVGRAFKEFNIDPSKDLLEVSPFMVLGTGSTSGPAIDLDGACSIEGLYAAGFGTSCPHLMSGISGSGISSFSAVNGYRAGEHAANRAKGLDAPAVHQAQVDASLADYFRPMGKLRQVRPSDVWLAIAKATCRPEFALFKTHKRIQNTLDELRQIRDDLVPKIYAPDFHELEKANEVKNYIDMAIITCQAMQQRTESRGELFRVDYPYQDNDNWLKWMIVANDGKSDVPTVRYEDVPYDRYEIKAPPGRTPSTYTVPDSFAAENDR